MNQNELALRKEKLIENLIAIVALKTPRIISAFRKILRHEFVTKEYIEVAYEDIALPTLKSSTISQPYTVAVMLEELQPKEGDKILEIGAGSGWQACLLAHCVGSKGKVISIEIDEDIAKLAKKNASKFKVKNLEIIQEDGSIGYKKEMPYDRIIYTAATSDIPKVVVKQLKVGGRIVAPIGNAYEQTMTVIDKISEKELKEKHLGSFIFVAMKGKYKL